MAGAMLVSWRSRGVGLIVARSSDKARPGGSLRPDVSLSGIDAVEVALPDMSCTARKHRPIARMVEYDLCQFEPQGEARCSSKSAPQPFQLPAFVCRTAMGGHPGRAQSMKDLNRCSWAGT
jgi:hypothetical protein